MEKGMDVLGGMKRILPHQSPISSYYNFMILDGGFPRTYFPVFCGNNQSVSHTSILYYNISFILSISACP